MNRITRTVFAAAATAVMAGPARGQVEYDLFLVDAMVPSYSLRETYLWDINDQGVAIGTTTGNTPK